MPSINRLNRYSAYSAFFGNLVCLHEIFSERFQLKATFNGSLSKLSWVILKTQ